jgi:Big-like domain-containing protein
MRFLVFGVLLVLPSPVPLTFELGPNGVVVAAAATLNTRLEPIAAQTPPRGEGNRDPRLRIDLPRDGAVVAPGDTLQVTVSSPNRTRFVAITIVMEDPIEYDKGATSLPAHFAIKIPRDISPGSYSLSATGGRAGGQLVVAVIEVDIERRELARAIRRRLPQLPQIYFEKRGETRDIELIGDFGNGDFVDVSKSSRVTFESSDTAVASVDTSGTITAVGAGQATVVAWYGPRNAGIKASIPVVVQ